MILRKLKDYHFRVFLYGHYYIDVLETNPFFNKELQSIDKTWKSYKSNNFIESDIYNKEGYIEKTYLI